MVTLYKTAFVLLMLATACHKEPMIRYGFDTDFDRNDQGLVLLHVAGNNKMLSLNGSISLKEGSLIVELIDPSGDRSFSRKFETAGSYEVLERTIAYSGYWKLRYQCAEGMGRISLHLNIIQ
ncbi:MAG: hypothetical protein LWX09_05525 [Bacteroidia bacterium]|nr:hypothetical protein [Bacteroidia bacterium]